MNPLLTQQQLGSLIYLVTCTCPDLAHAVSVLLKFCVHPLEVHNLAVHHLSVERVFRHHISKTHSHGLIYSRISGPLSLVGYSDTGNGNCWDTIHNFIWFSFRLLWEIYQAALCRSLYD